MTRPHEARAREALTALRRAGFTVALAESCTGGLVAAALTDIPGSSASVDRGFVTYSNASKIELLGVPAELVERFGAVSEPVARAMAEGALAASRADLAVAVTGVAGPGGSDRKPEGLVHFACARRGGETIEARREFGALGRSRVRDAAVEQALAMLIEAARAAAPHAPTTQVADRRDPEASPGGTTTRPTPSDPPR